MGKVTKVTKVTERVTKKKPKLPEKRAYTVKLKNTLPRFWSRAPEIFPNKKKPVSPTGKTQPPIRPARMGGYRWVTFCVTTSTSSFQGFTLGEMKYCLCLLRLPKHPVLVPSSVTCHFRGRLSHIGECVWNSSVETPENHFSTCVGYSYVLT